MPLLSRDCAFAEMKKESEYNTTNKKAGGKAVEDILQTNRKLEEAQERETKLLEKARKEWNGEKKEVMQAMKKEFATSIENINQQMDDLKNNLSGDPKKLVEQITALNKIQQHMTLEHQSEIEKLKDQHEQKSKDVKSKHNWKALRTNTADPPHTDFEQ